LREWDPIPAPSEYTNSTTDNCWGTHEAAARRNNEREKREVRKARLHESRRPSQPPGCSYAGDQGHSVTSVVWHQEVSARATDCLLRECPVPCNSSKARLPVL